MQKSIFSLPKLTGGGASISGKEAAKAAAYGVASEGTSIFNVALFGGFGVVSAIANYIEYLAERREIAHFYREEFSAKGNKPVHQIGDNDLSAAERTNGTIKEAVDRERNIRNVGIAASFIASVAVFTLMSFVAPHIHMAATLEFAAKVAVGGLSYLAVKTPLSHIGESLFGLDKETTHDLIHAIAQDHERGKAITREQVVEVFMSGNKQLGAYVEQRYGQSYSELALADKVRVAEEIAHVIPVDKIVNNINLGTASATELAYTVQGDVSGVLPKMAERPRKLSTFGKLMQAMSAMTGMFRAEKAHPIPEISAINRSQRTFEPVAESPIEELNNGVSHVERLGRTPRDAGKGYVEQMAERSAQTVTLAGSNTLQ